MKTPVAKPNVTVTQGRSPFMPVVVINHPPANLGLTNPYTGPRSDECHAYVNYDGVTPILYNGQTQTGPINQIKPIASLPMHVLPGASPPSYSKIP